MFGKNVKVTAQYDDFFDGRKPNFHEIKLLIGKFDKESVTIVVSKLGLLLSDKKMMKFENQLTLARVFVHDQRLRNFIEKLSLDRNPERIIFFRESLTLLGKINLEYNTSNGWKIESTNERTELLKIILCINQLITRSADDDRKIHRRKRRQNMEIYRKGFTIQFLNTPSNDELLNQVARGNELIKNIVKRGNIDIKGIFASKTGIDVQLFMDMIFMISTDWVISVDTTKINQIVAKDIQKFFSSTKISTNEIMAFNALMTINSEDYQKFNTSTLERFRIRSEESIENLFTLMQRPLVRQGEHSYLINPYLLMHQFTNAPYNIVREALKGTKQEDLFPEEWGNAYEEYINERLIKAFGDKVNTNVKIKDKKSIDAIIEFHDYIFLVEVKYIHWSAKARVTGSRKEVVEYIKKFSRHKPYLDKHGKIKRKRKGFGQIKDFYENHKRHNTNIDTCFANKKIVPIVILGEEFPFDPFNRELMMNVIKNEECIIKEDGVLPPIVLSSSETELIESISEELGAEKAKFLIAEYSESLIGAEKLNYLDRPTTFNNYVISKEISVNNNSSLGYALRNLYKRVKPKFRKGV